MSITLETETHPPIWRTPAERKSQVLKSMEVTSTSGEVADLPNGGDLVDWLVFERVGRSIANPDVWFTDITQRMGSWRLS